MRHGLDFDEAWRLLRGLGAETGKNHERAEEGRPGSRWAHWRLSAEPIKGVTEPEARWERQMSVTSKKGEREFQVKKEREQRSRSSWFGDGQPDVPRALHWHSGGTVGERPGGKQGPEQRTWEAL